MNIRKKFLIIFSITNFLIILLYVNNFEVRAIDLSTMENQASGFINKGFKQANGKIKISSITSEFQDLGKILTFIGAGVMVAVVSYMGIKYLISPPDKQAVLKQQLIGVVVAGVVIFGAYGIWSAVVGVVSKF